MFLELKGSRLGLYWGRIFNPR